MGIASLLLILAIAAPPASQGRHVDAVEIFSYDFGPQWDVNYDLWPDKWRRQLGPDMPHYVQAQLEDDQDAVAGRCLVVRLNGGGALLTSPAVSVSDKFSYVVDTRLKAAKLQHSRVRIHLEFCDEERNVLESVASGWYSNTNGWITVRIDPVSITHPEVRLAQITLLIEKGEQVDLEGVVSLDDVWLARLPRMSVHTNSPFNVYTNPQDVTVTCDLSGILEQDPDIRFELLDASSHRLKDDTVQLDGRLITERLSKASDIINSSVARPKGYAGSSQWRPPIKEYGFYRVRVSMQTARGTLKDHVISIAVVPPLNDDNRGEFGWSLAGDDIPLSFENLQDLLSRVAVSWVKLPVWYGENEPERGDELVQFTERLAAKEIEVVGVLDRPPADLDFGRPIAADVTIADLLSGEDPDIWLPSLDAVLTRLSLRVRWWQLGIDSDTSYCDFRNLEQEIEELRGKMFRFGQDVSLGIGWPWNKMWPVDKPATWDFQQLSAAPSFTGQEIATYLQLPARQGVARWIVVDPLDRKHYDLETRTRDLVEQMLAAKIRGAEGIFVNQPFDDDRGIMTDAGTPGELLLPWRTTSALLSGAQYLGELRMPGQSENRVFETNSGEVLMVIWNRQPAQEVMYLGEDVRVVDVWGRAQIPEQEGNRQVIEVANLPQFILGLDPHVARWRMSMRIAEPDIPSVFGFSHPNRIEITSPFEQGLGGTVQLVGPEGWQVLPNRIDFKLSGGEKAQRPFHIVLPFNAVNGPATIRADFDFSADRQYKFSVYREVVVGDKDIDLELHTRFEDDGTLVVEQRMINYAETPVDFKCLLYAPGRRRQRMQVFRLTNSADIKVYKYSNGQDLIGSELWLRAEEQGGNRVFNYRVIAEP
jgi:hypothetical protein